MKIAVIRAGRVRGYFGGKLACAGHDVTFVSRGEHLKAIREKGLKVTDLIPEKWSVHNVSLRAY